MSLDGVKRLLWGTLTLRGEASLKPPRRRSAIRNPKSLVSAMQVSRRLGDIVSRYRPVLDKYETLYKRFHRYPELSLQEINTSLKIIQHLNELGFEVVSNIGGHGIVGVLRNNPDHNSKVVLLRADMDALPIEEKTGLEYASTEKMVDTDGVEKPVMHACGHDVHITALLAAAELLMAAKNEWRGTAVVLFQPNEERAGGARAMVEDGLYEKIPKPNVVLGGHIGPVLSGMVATRPGAMAAAADSFKVTLRGKGGHGAEPHRTIDPVVMAASIILRLQTIVSREVDPMQTAVVTVGSIQAGGAENVIPEEAVLKVNVRAFDEAVREKVLAAVRRIIRAECEASAAPGTCLRRWQASGGVSRPHQSSSRICGWAREKTAMEC